MLTKKQLKIALWAVLLSSSEIALSIKLLHSQPPFNISELHRVTDYHPEWEIASLPEEKNQEIKKALSQNFQYLGEGAQCFAFESADHQFVLKIFKARFQRPRSTRHSLKKIFFEDPNAIQKKQEKWHKLFLEACNSYKIAFDELGEETGTIFLHFNPTHDQFQPIELEDQKGNRHSVQLDGIPFFVQKKADLLVNRLQQLVEANNIQGVQKIIEAFERHIEARAQKGITDHKQAFNINYGLINDEIVQFDAGKIYKDDKVKQDPEEEILRIKNNFLEWLYKRYPQLKNQ